MRLFRFLQWFTAGDPIVPLPKSVSGRQVGLADGFSLLELERVGLSERQAREFGLAIDSSRRTALGSNLVQLEKFLNAKR